MADLFASKKGAKKKGDAKQESGAPSDTQKSLNEMAARIKMTEERFSELRKKLQFLEQSMLSHQKKFLRELKTLSSDLTDNKHEVSEIKNRIGLIIKELQLSASREDVDVLRKYLDLWQPVKFVTETQVERILDERLGGEGHG